MPADEWQRLEGVAAQGSMPPATSAAAPPQLDDAARLSPMLAASPHCSSEFEARWLEKANLTQMEREAVVDEDFRNLPVKVRAPRTLQDDDMEIEEEALGWRTHDAALADHTGLKKYAVYGYDSPCVMARDTPEADQGRLTSHADDDVIRTRGQPSPTSSEVAAPALSGETYDFVSPTPSPPGGRKLRSWAIVPFGGAAPQGITVATPAVAVTLPPPAGTEVRSDSSLRVVVAYLVDNYFGAAGTQ